MQRKNNILKSSRNGIAMIMAITVILIVATIMALSLAMTTQTTKRTTDIYLYEQAMLLSKSATEYALLQISENAPCIYMSENFTQDGFYDINITNRYVYTAPLPAACPADTIIVQTPEQNGSVIMDVTVTVDDKSITNETIRFFRRSIQKL